MKRFLMGLVAMPLVLVGVSACGVSLAALGTAVELIVNTKDPGWPLALRWPFAAAVALLGMLGVVHGFRLVSGAPRRLPKAALRALSDAVVMIATFGCVTGLAFLAMSLFPAFAGQAWPLRATGALLIAGSTAVLLMRFRASRSSPQRPVPPDPLKNATAQAVPPEEQASLDFHGAVLS